MNKYKIDWYADKIYVRRPKVHMTEVVVPGVLIILAYQIFMTAGKVAAIIQG